MSRRTPPPGIKRHSWKVRGSWTASLLFAGYALLTYAWVFGNAPFSNPDERSHYLRAIELGGGELIGAPAEFPVAGQSPKQQAWINKTSRAVAVPPRLSPEGMDCMVYAPDRSAACVLTIAPPEFPTRQVTSNGTYQPLFYVLPGIAARFGSEPLWAHWLGRLVSATTSLLLLAPAVLILGKNGEGGYTLSGLMASVSPMVLFVASGLSTSGPEIAAGISFGACLLRLGSRPTLSGPLLAGLVVSGGALILSRSTGPAWAFLYVSFFLAFVGPKRILEVVRASPLRSLFGFLALAGALILNLAWESKYGPESELHLPSIKSLIQQITGFVPVVLRESIGAFGFVEIYLPEVAYLLWQALLVSLVTLALIVGTRRHRFTLIALAALSLSLGGLLYVLIIEQTGYGVQGRHVMPFVVFLPIVAGEILRMNRARIEPLAINLLPFWAGLATGSIHFLGWWLNSRRSAVSMNGDWLFFVNPAWSPPLGWYTWLIAAALGTALIIASGLMASRISR